MEGSRPSQTRGRILLADDDRLPGGNLSRALRTHGQFEVVHDERFAGPADTGNGMDQATMGRAFEPFFTTKPKGHGTGLGLATVYGIVTQAGGSIDVYSEPGLGTTISVLLPATDEAAVPEQAASPGSGVAGKGETILLVEDEEELREMTRRILAGHGYLVTAAAWKPSRWPPIRSGASTCSLPT
jgi:hypothetical protein